ncbi:hypothetical protein GDO81_003670 [Engystomops pustulosus]|uniref:Secreted protein n=1 Tax=Engystomops pustulosus TaxID=76066 RepID=A0AAV7A2W8_ENGPU|nr:hypothetical protein GDO81_003670 [Engystomops pustulosus]
MGNVHITRLLCISAWLLPKKMNQKPSENSWRQDKLYIVRAQFNCQVIPMCGKNIRRDNLSQRRRHKYPEQRTFSTYCR